MRTRELIEHDDGLEEVLDALEDAGASLTDDRRRDGGGVTVERGHMRVEVDASDFSVRTTWRGHPSGDLYKERNGTPAYGDMLSHAFRCGVAFAEIERVLGTELGGSSWPSHLEARLDVGHHELVLKSRIWPGNLLIGLRCRAFLTSRSGTFLTDELASVVPWVEEQIGEIRRQWLSESTSSDVPDTFESLVDSLEDSGWSLRDADVEHVYLSKGDETIVVNGFSGSFTCTMFRDELLRSSAAGHDAGESAERALAAAGALDVLVDALLRRGFTIDAEASASTGHLTLELDGETVRATGRNTSVVVSDPDGVRVSALVDSDLEDFADGVVEFMRSGRTLVEVYGPGESYRRCRGPGGRVVVGREAPAMRAREILEEIEDRWAETIDALEDAGWTKSDQFSDIVMLKDNASITFARWAIIGKVAGQHLFQSGYTSPIEDLQRMIALCEAYAECIALGLSLKFRSDDGLVSNALLRLDLSDGRRVMAGLLRDEHEDEDIPQIVTAAVWLEDADGDWLDAIGNRECHATDATVVLTGFIRPWLARTAT